MVRRPRWPALLAAALLLALLLPAARSAPTSPWTLTTPLPEDTLVQILHDGQRYIAWSAGGVMLTSDDGLAWSAQGLPVSDPVVAAAYGNGRLVFMTLAPKTAGSDVKVWNNLYGSDKERWNKTEGPVGIRLYSLWFSEDRFVALGEHVLTQEVFAYYSVDGRNWTERTPSWEEHPQIIGQVGASTAYGYANRTVFRQVDHGKWNRYGEIPRDHAPQTVTGAAYGNGRIVVAGAAKDGSPWLRYTVDGKEWKSTALPAATRLNGLTFAAGHFLAVGNGVYAVSKDGAAWSTQESPALQLHSLVVQGSNVVAVGRSGEVVSALLGDLYRNAGYKPLLLVPGGTGPNCPGFTDVLSSDLICPAIAKLSQIKAVSGYPDGTFRANEKVTRAAFAKMVVLALARKADPNAAAPFTDTGDHWAVKQGYIQAAVRMGAVGGFPDGAFRPDEPVTRAQMVKVVIASAGLRVGTATFYQDVTGSWYEPFVNQALGGGLIGPTSRQKVYTERQFRGDLPATRAEAALLLANLFE